jgi:hypothetical protein
MAILTSDLINQRLAQAIANSNGFNVVREDILGEGEGAWDPDPRYPNESVNCLTWIQFLISEVYSKDSEDKLRIMDRVRYYGGQVAYGLRKHFLDHWLSVEPEPLKKIPIKDVVGYETHAVTLDFDKFKTFHNYSGLLYREDLTDFVVESLTPEGLISFAQTLNKGFYFMFAIPTKKYLDLFAQNCGPLGVVHSIVLQVTEKTVVYHASTQHGKVVSLDLNDYVNNMKSVFSGYVLYVLDNQWDYPVVELDTSEMLPIKISESLLKPSNQNRVL